MTVQADKKYYAIAKRYSRALVEIADGDFETIERFSNELREVVLAFESSNDLKHFFAHPTVSMNDKKDVLKELFVEKIDKNLFNFLNILVEENRVDVLSTIGHTFEEEKNELLSVAKVFVTSAVELYDDEKQRLQAKLEGRLNKKVIIDYQIKREIIAGLIIQFGNSVIDSSVQTKFENMKKALI